MSDHLHYQTDGALATITFDRPTRKNAVTQAMWQHLPELITRAAADDAIRVVILTGANGAFIAGADISEFETAYGTRERAAAYSAEIATAMECVANCPKPVIAKISGPCFGGGCGLALACDIRFADITATFCIPPAKLGIAYSLADTRRIVDAVGISATKDILYTARVLAAAEANQIGLIDKVFPASDLDAHVRDYAQRIAGNAPYSIAAAKDYLKRIAAGQTSDDPDTEARGLAAFEGPDFKEGYRAFLEKRKPDF